MSEIRKAKRTTRTSYGPAQTMTRTMPGQTSRTYRMSMGPTSGGMIRSSNVSMSYGMAPSGSVAAASKQSVKQVVQDREKEKNDLSNCNEKFLHLIGTKRMNEAMVNDLMDECEKLRALKMFPSEKIHEIYKDEIEDLRKRLQDAEALANKEKAEREEWEDRCETEKLKNNDLKKQIADLELQIREMGREMAALKGELEQALNTIECNEGECEREKHNHQETSKDNDRLRNDLQEAEEKFMNAQCEANMLDEELQLTREAMGTEIEALHDMIKQMQSKAPERQQMWQNEFAKCIKDMKDEFGRQMAVKVDENRKFYDNQLAEIRRANQKDGVDSNITKTQNSTLKSQLGDRNARLNEVDAENDALKRRLVDLQARHDAMCVECEDEKAELCAEIDKLKAELEEVRMDSEELRSHCGTLDMEIATYRKLLEEEEGNLSKIMTSAHRDEVQSRGGHYMAQMIKGGGGGGASQQQSSIESQTSTSFSHRRMTQLGGVGFGEAVPDGSCIELKNTTSKDFDLSRWTLKKTHAKGTVSFKFPNNSILKAKKNLTVFGEFASDQATEKTDIVAVFKSWGPTVGKFSLLDEKLNEKASLDIKIGGK